MPDGGGENSSPRRTKQIEGLPVIRRNVAGIDLGSERHWVCAPVAGSISREVADFGATTPELIRMTKWRTRLVNGSSVVAQLTAYSRHAGNEAGVLEQADS